ncbi:MAG: hypothetical protein QF805_30860, partial [Pirellulaceae bacterium]|nr:hypothetical protein [Pirellulaceae bacterium]
MKTTVSCDLVFDVLTRGPFPTGHADDALVEQHLATCHECRNLADALRPAVDLFHECLIADDQLPQYEGRLPAPRPAAHDAIMAAVREVEAERPRMGVFNLETIRLILTVAAVVMLAVLVVDHFGGDEDARRISRMSSARQPDEIGVQLLVSLKLA